MGSVSSTRELQQAPPLIEEAHAVAEVAAEGKDGVERGGSESGAEAYQHDQWALAEVSITPIGVENESSTGEYRVAPP